MADEKLMRFLAEGITMIKLNDGRVAYKEEDGTWTLAGDDQIFNTFGQLLDYLEV